MNDHQGKYGRASDNKSPSGISALSIIRSVRRKLWGENDNDDSDEGETNYNIVYNQEVNSNDDGPDGRLTEPI